VQILTGNYRGAIREVGATETDGIRTDIVKYLLRRITVGLKAELDSASFLNGGRAELESSEKRRRPHF
jgi:hypothetical protein